MTEKNSNHLVISNYNCDPTYLLNLSDTFSLYDKSDDPYYEYLIAQLSKNVHYTYNYGHNLCDILDYIVDNYESLPPKIAFVKGNIVPRHISLRFLKEQLSRGIYSFLWNEEFEQGEVGGVKFAPGYFAEINTSWYVSEASHKFFLSLDDFLDFMFVGYKPSKFIIFSPGACYLVERERILNNPKSLYQALRKVISYDFRTAECFMLERSLHLLFDRTYQLRDYCYDEKSFIAQLNLRPDVTGAHKSGKKKGRIDHYLWRINRATGKLMETRSSRRNNLEM